MQALVLYQSHSDKNWGLIDCISFVVMRQHNLSNAVTGDRHFIQAGFRALMLEVQW
jgi:predicted nucleic acid-binding protein